MKFFYSIILLMTVMNVNASEKKLRAKLEREYDLQLVQKEKAIQSRKLLQSVAKKQKSNIRNDQQESIKNNKNLEIKQQKRWQREEEALIKWKEEYTRRHIFGTIIPFAFVISACFYPVLCVMGSMHDGAPIGCYNSGNVCKCFYV